jgi:hypothetical protein
VRQLGAYAAQENFRIQCRSKFPLSFRRIARVMSPCGKCTVVMVVYNNTFVKENKIIHVLLQNNKQFTCCSLRSIKQYIIMVTYAVVITQYYTILTKENVH